MEHNNIFTLVKGIYKKEQLTVDKIDVSLCIALTNILRLDKNNLNILKRIIPYLFFIEPKKYLMLLFICIPYNKYPPFLKGVSKQKNTVKEDKLYNKIAYLLNWSSKELKIYKNILDKVIDRDYWEKELAIKDTKKELLYTKYPEEDIKKLTHPQELEDY